MPDELVVAPTWGRICGLCWLRFRDGDAYKSVWRGGSRPGERVLGFNVHQACFAQLDPGDLTRLFYALERRLALPIAVLNGQRVDLDQARRLLRDGPPEPESARDLDLRFRVSGSTFRGDRAKLEARSAQRERSERRRSHGT